MRHKIISVFLLVGILLAPGVVAQSNAAEGQPIRHIIVEGNQRIEVETVLSYLRIQEGEKYSDKKVNESLKRLFATGLFADVKVVQRNSDLVITVVENPIINKISFEGNKRLEDKALQDEIKLYPRAVYTKERLREDVNRIVSIYNKSGRFSVSVVPKVVQLAQNRIDLIFEIDEGPKTTVKKISFVGNGKFSDKALSKVIQTKEAAWYRFFSGSDTYDEDRLAFDKELLRKFYVTRGYADFQVTSTVVELTPEKDAFFITFVLEEGEKYNFGDINIKSDIPNIHTDKLEEVTLTKKDEVFNAVQVEDSIDAMVNSLSDQGFAFVNIEPVFDKHPKEKIVNVTYQIREGAKVYVNRINIKGNVRTLDEVIRREFRLEEGDPYNAAKIRRSRDRLRNLGFFENVDIQNERVPDALDRVDLDVNVSERSTGEMNFGAGFSTGDGALANVSVRERNLLGKGQDLRFNLQTATKGLEADVGFTEPYFMGKEVAAGFDVFSITRDRRTESNYDSESIGTTLRADYAVSEYLNHQVRYSIRSDKITNVTDLASRFVKDQEGENMTSLIGHSLIYDKRDNKFDPREGYYLRFNQDFAGIGGDSQFIRNELRGAYYLPVFRDDVVLELSGTAGDIFGWGGEDVRINERFFLGGQNLRGFKSAGVGPRDSVTNDALGGNTYYTFGSEMRFPLGLPEELGFTGAIFAEAGSLFDLDDTGPEVVDKSSLRASVGTGVAWGSPLGPIRIDFAVPVMKENFDKEQKFRINFGTRF